jgi:hypothetical protein
MRTNGPLNRAIPSWVSRSGKRLQFFQPQTSETSSDYLRLCDPTRVRKVAYARLASRSDFKRVITLRLEFDKMVTGKTYRKTKSEDMHRVKVRSNTGAAEAKVLSLSGK